MAQRRHRGSEDSCLHHPTPARCSRIDSRRCVHQQELSSRPRFRRKKNPQKAAHHRLRGYDRQSPAPASNRFGSETSMPPPRFLYIRYPRERQGVMLSFDTFLASIESITGLGMLTAEDRISQYSLHHIFPLPGHCSLSSLYGTTIAFARSLNPEDILATLNGIKSHVSRGSPTLRCLHASLM